VLSQTPNSSRHGLLTRPIPDTGGQLLYKSTLMNAATEPLFKATKTRSTVYRPYVVPSNSSWQTTPEALANMGVSATLFTNPTGSVTAMLALANSLTETKTLEISIGCASRLNNLRVLSAVSTGGTTYTGVANSMTSILSGYTGACGGTGTANSGISAKRLKVTMPSYSTMNLEMAP
jgi:hypothetical protein